MVTTADNQYDRSKVVHTMLTRLKEQVMQLDVDSTDEHVLIVWNRIKQLRASAKVIEEDLKQFLIDTWIKENGDLVEGQCRYYVTQKKTTKQIKKQQALAAMLEATDNDIEIVADVLVSAPFKPAAMKKLLGDLAGAYLEVEYKDEVKDGKVKPIKQVKKYDPAFSTSEED